MKNERSLSLLNTTLTDLLLWCLVTLAISDNSSASKWNGLSLQKFAHQLGGWTSCPTPQYHRLKMNSSPELVFEKDINPFLFRLHSGIENFFWLIRINYNKCMMAIPLKSTSLSTRFHDSLDHPELVVYSDRFIILHVNTMLVETKINSLRLWS